MLYKAMQVKEIPIVFRGNIDGATITPAPDPLFDEDLTFVTMPPPGVGAGADLTGLSLDDYNNIFVKFGDQLFKNIPKVDQGGGYYSFGDDQGTFEEYPFMITIVPDYGCVMVIEEAGEKHVEIWGSDPLPETTPTKKTFTAELTGNGQIKRFHARFACGENGTLHINPYVILNGNIPVNLCDFAKEGENYISGDNEDFAFECYVPIETHAVLYVEAENVGEYASMLDVAIVVQYEDFIEEETIVGYEGINLRRIHR